MEKVAIVTGAASGMGRCTVQRLVGEGWAVWALDISAENLGILDKELDAGDRFNPVVCNAASASDLHKAMEAVNKTTDSIDALVICAGVTIVGKLDQISEDNVDTLIDVNMKAPWLTVRAALPLLQKNASTHDPSRVVIIGSISGMRPKFGNGMYSATKAAVHVLTGVFAAELGPTGVIVNAIAPATTDTPMMAQTASQIKDSSFNFSGSSPLGRIAKADDITDVTMFFLSDSAKYVNGAILPVDGGTRAAFIKN